MARFFARAFFKVFPFFKTVIKSVSINEVSGLTKIKVADSEIFSLERKEDIYGKFHDDFNQDAYTAVIPPIYIYIGRELSKMDGRKFLQDRKKF